MPDDTTSGPVESALAQWLQHIEVAMWAEDIDPGRTIRVINRLAFGHPGGGQGGNRVEGLPEWAEELGASMVRVTSRSVKGRLHQMARPCDEPAVADGVRLVVLAAVRQVLQSNSPIEQVLNGQV